MMLWKLENYLARSEICVFARAKMNRSSRSDTDKVTRMQHETVFAAVLRSRHGPMMLTLRLAVIILWILASS